MQSVWNLYDGVVGSRFISSLVFQIEKHLQFISVRSLPRSELTRIGEIAAVAFLANPRAAVAGVLCGSTGYWVMKIVLLTFGEVNQDAPEEAMGRKLIQVIGRAISLRRVCYITPIVEECQIWVIRKALGIFLKFAAPDLSKKRKQLIAAIASTAIFVLNHHRRKSFKWMVLVFPVSFLYAEIGDAFGITASVLAHMVHNIFSRTFGSFAVF